METRKKNAVKLLCAAGLFAAMFFGTTKDSEAQGVTFECVGTSGQCFTLEGVTYYGKLHATDRKKVFTAGTTLEP